MKTRSLRFRVVTITVLFALFISAITILLCRNHIQNISDTLYRTRANELSATIAESLDVETVERFANKVIDVYNSIDNRVRSDDWGSEAFNEYISKYSFLEEDEDYKYLLNHLRRFQDKNTVECLYLITLMGENEDFMYLIDAAEEDQCPIGTIDPLYDINKAVLDDPMIGFPAYITNTEEYGWLVTAGSPIEKKDNGLVCYAAVDISMDKIRAEQHGFIVRLTSVLLIMTLIITILAVLIFDKTVIGPINLLSSTAKEYMRNGINKKKSFKSLKIDTKDEIESLHKSMVKMEDDINDYIKNLSETKAELTSSQAETIRMSELANKDALTGLRNNLSYQSHVQQLNDDLLSGEKKFGFAIIDLNDLKHINDTYGHDRGNISIITISKLVCDVFTHSPVFRIGGDEFAVILKDHDYDHIEELRTNFIEKNKQLQKDMDKKPWEKPSAAIGYALYDENKDTYVEDVFRKADKKMYENKNRLKKQ